MRWMKLNKSGDHIYSNLDTNWFSTDLTSPDCSSCEKIYDMLNSIFPKNEYLFKATGLPTNIKNIISNLGCRSYEYFEGDEKKFYIKRFPEVLAKVETRDLLHKVIFEWDKTIYERRFIYVIKEGLYNAIYEVLKSVTYQDENHTTKVLPYVECIIENVPEADYHATFKIICKSEYWEAVTKIINQEAERNPTSEL